MAKQLLGTNLVQNGAGIDPRRHLKRDSRRNIRLDQSGNHVHGRSLRGQDQMNAGRPALLRQSCDEFFHLFAHDHHQVRQFVDDDDDVRQRAQGCPFFFVHIQRVEDRLVLLIGAVDLTVKTRNVADAERGHQFVAALHLNDRPAQRVGRILHVGDDRCQQVRDTVVYRQFQHLRVDHDHADFLRGGFVDHTQNQGVDAYGFTGTRGAGDQYMGHLAKIYDYGPAADVFSQHQRQRRTGVFVSTGRQTLDELHGLALLVGYLQADHRLARNIVHDPYAYGGQRSRQIPRQPLDLAGLHPGGGFDLEPRNYGPRMDRYDLDVNVEIGQFLLQQP